MEYTKLTNTELEISRIGIGCWAIGGHGWGYVDDNESIKAIHAALDSGVNFFDTADVYGLGHSERILSKALGNHRSNGVISTKFGLEWDESRNIQNNTPPERVVEAVETSLRRLNIESIPLYLIHHFDGVTPIEKTMEALIECKKAGKIQNIGCSNLSMEMVDEANRLIPLSAVQIPYNVIDRGVEEDILPFLNELNISSLAFSSLAHGLLSGKYASKVEFSHDDIRSRSPYFQDQAYKDNMAIVKQIENMAEKYEVTTSQMSIRWILDNPSIAGAITGVKKDMQVIENMGALDWNMTDLDRASLDY